MKKAIGKTVRNGKERRAGLRAVSLIVSFQVLAWVLFSMATPGLVGAKTFIVDSTLDEPDKNPGDGVCMSASGHCTLRAAIQEANALPGPDVIKLKTGLYMLTIPGRSEDGSATGDLDITEDLAIIGTGANNTFINGGKLDRVFHIIGSISVSFTNLTIQNGFATEGGPSGEAVGGGIFNDGGALEIMGCTISNNNASGSDTANGGGIYSSGGSLTIKRSTISNNVAEGNSFGVGGGIYADTALTITGSTLSNNVARGNSCSQGYGDGGGIYHQVGTLTITGSILSNNSASGNIDAYGGGISSGMSTGTITKSTLADNSALGNSALGGIGEGGGICFGLATFTITGSTLSNNSASGIDGYGGGIWNGESTLTITGSTLSNNSVSGITAGNGGGIYNHSTTLTVQSSSRIVSNFASDGEGGIYSDNPSTVTISHNSTVSKNIPNDKNF